MKRFLVLLLTLTLVLGMTGGLHAQEQDIDPIEMVDLDGWGDIYASGVITSPDQELWFVGDAKHGFTNFAGVYDPSGSLNCELFDANFEDIGAEYQGSYDNGNYRGTAFWTGGQRYHIKVTYKPNRPFQATPFHVYMGFNETVNLPELPEVPGDQNPTDIYFRDIYVELAQGETTQLTPVILPADANKTLTWRSNNPAIASVDANGVVTANGVGMAFITAETVNGLTAQCVVNVVEGAVVPDTHTVTITESVYDGLNTIDIGVTIETVEAGQSYTVRLENPGLRIEDCIVQGAIYDERYEEDHSVVYLIIDEVNDDINIYITYGYWMTK